MYYIDRNRLRGQKHSQKEIGADRNHVKRTGTWTETWSETWPYKQKTQLDRNSSRRQKHDNAAETSREQHQGEKHGHADGNTVAWR